MNIHQVRRHGSISIEVHQNTWNKNNITTFQEEKDQYGINFSTSTISARENGNKNNFKPQIQITHPGEKGKC